MKLYNHISILAILLCAFLSHMASSQQEKSQEFLAGTWILDYNMTLAKREKQMQTVMDTLPQIQKSAIENNYLGRTMSLESNGVFKQFFPDGRNVNGTWALDKVSMGLVLTDPSGRSYVQTIQELTDKTLVLRLEDVVGAKLFIKELYFIKN